MHLNALALEGKVGTSHGSHGVCL